MSNDNVNSTSGVFLKCEGCGKAYKVHPEKVPQGVTSFPCRACGTLVPMVGLDQKAGNQGDQRVILVVVEEKELTELIERILGLYGYRAMAAHTGKDAVETFRANPIDAVLINVFLPDMMGYEILDAINEGREDGGKVPSILLSSIHHAARYKRAPTSLYGADDYVERHHLPDLLVPKIERLLEAGGKEQPAVDPSKLPPPEDHQIKQRREIENLEMQEQPSQDPATEEIRRLCRVIAGDIALYNEDVITTSGPGQVLDAISQDLAEGEALLDRKFPGKGDQSYQLLREEMANLLETRGITDP